MDDFLKELQALMTRHNATILRSANEVGTLVVSVPESDGTFSDIAFEEDIDGPAVRDGRYSTVAK